MTLDVRFHKYITEKDVNNWCEYFWELGKRIDELIISEDQARSLAKFFTRATRRVTDKRTKGWKIFQTMLDGSKVHVYSTDYQDVSLKVKKGYYETP